MNIYSLLLSVIYLIKIKRLCVEHVCMQEGIVIHDNTLTLHLKIDGAIRITINGQSIHPKARTAKVRVPTEPFIITVTASGVFESKSYCIPVLNVLPRPSTEKIQYPLAFKLDMQGADTQALSSIKPTLIIKPPKRNLAYNKLLVMVHTRLPQIKSVSILNTAS
jgi:hypothetical protein